VTIGRNLAPSQRAGDLIALIRCIRFPNPSFAGGLLLLRVLRSHQDDEDDGVTTASQALPAIFNFPKPQKFRGLALLQAECDTKPCILTCSEAKTVVQIGHKEASSKEELRCQLESIAGH
jgi:hypothetical protein